MKRILSLLSLCLSTLASLNHAHATNVLLQWNASNSSVVAGYNVYCATTSGNFLYRINAGKATSVTISHLTPGSIILFFATAYDSYGHESAPSAQISYVVPYALTLAPGATPHGPPVLQFDAVTGHWYEIQATVHFRGWTSIWQSGLVLLGSKMQYTDYNAGAYESRFYRLVVH